MNDPENGRRHFWAEGLDKSLIDKRQNRKIEQSLTEAPENHLIIWSHYSSQRRVKTHTLLRNYSSVSVYRVYGPIILRL